MRILKRDGIHGRSPLKGILSEHSEQAPIFIKNSFQTTALIWILSLWKKPNSPSLGKTADAMEKTKHMDFMPSGWRFKEHRAARWMERMKRIISFLLREHATVFYRVIFLFWHKTDLHGWRADGRARSHNLKSVHGNIGKKITFFNLIILLKSTWIR